MLSYNKKRENITKIISDIYYQMFGSQLLSAIQRALLILTAFIFNYTKMNATYSILGSLLMPSVV